MDRGVITLGAQGVGKSIIVWAWASHQAMHGKKSILSVHVDSAMFSSCTLLSATDCRLSNIEDPKELIKLLHTLPLKFKAAVERHMDCMMDKVSNLKILLDEAQGYQAKDSSNQLLMRSKESGRTEIFFASRYVLKRLLHESRERGDIQRAYDLATRHANPSYLGCVVEFDFVEHLYQTV
jgi:hypothetical protein